MNSPYTCVDLFSGCGGLSLGLKQAGFEVKLAVEKSPMAGETYYHNFIQPIHDPEEWRLHHEELSAETQAKSGLVIRELADVLASDEILSWLRESEIDLVAGGPPCQGFSLAGRRNPNDVRNQLPWQFLTFVEKIRPKAVIIENVSGMRHAFRKHGAVSPFDELRIALSETGSGYAVQPMLLNAMHFGAPQNRQRVFLVAVRNDLVAEKFVDPYGNTWNSALDSPDVTVLGKRPFLAPKRTHFDLVGEPQHLTVRDAISDLLDHSYNEEGPVSEYAREMRSDTRFLKAAFDGGLDNNEPTSHVRRRHSEHVKERFRLYQFFSRASIHSGVLSIPKKADISAYARRKMMLEAISGVEYPVSNRDGTILAKDQRAMMRLLNKLATKKHSQRALKWRDPSPTVVSLPDDYVHPSEPRIPTVRELARFQSFPDAFKFRSKETTGAHRRRLEVPQYTQVGNAVPPRLAKALGDRLHAVLRTATREVETTEESIAVA
ncbi:DNA cytosine methyltransferase [Parasedimentitalea psychrophila]|uniref:Cytosine-specific methyltransferase n=1 Tax=Parasedimentitalea psychrophila TaxID=2997337 RepID=A0A9Y2L0E2_9RHOB|nr:DNA cytosine methyltransferase [Parasedimentitalea psychrophila]WIY26008.1 DNA cytosine methyltransferase [Parasedimentitalea psychrophila]